MNVRQEQAYCEESLVGTHVRMWEGSVHGNYMGTVQGVVILKRLLGLLLRYEV